MKKYFFTFVNNIFLIKNYLEPVVYIPTVQKPAKSKNVQILRIIKY